MKVKRIRTYANILMYFIVCWFFSSHAYASEVLYIIVNAKSTVQTLTKKEVKNIFLGEIKSFPNGNPAKPVVQPIGAPSRAAFMNKIIQRNESRWRAHWARLLFTGKGIPPLELEEDDELLEVIARKKGAIGYFVGEDKEYKGVRVLMKVRID